MFLKSFETELKSPFFKSESNLVAVEDVLRSELPVKLLSANVIAVDPAKPPCFIPCASDAKLAIVFASVLIDGSSETLA